MLGADFEKMSVRLDMIDFKLLPLLSLNLLSNLPLSNETDLYSFLQYCFYLFCSNNFFLFFFFFGWNVLGNSAV